MTAVLESRLVTRRAGGDRWLPIFPELRYAKLAKDRIVQPDEVVRRAPDVIVASWCGKAVRKEKIASRAGWDEHRRSGHCRGGRRP